MIVQNLKMYKEPKLYDDVYFNIDRGSDKYLKEVNAIDYLVKSFSLNKNIVDFACGTGTHLSLFAQKGYKGLGIDINPSMLEEAKAKNSNEMSFIQGNICDVKINQKFDVAISMYSAFNYLETTDDVLKALKNIYSIINDGGIFILDTRWAKNQPNDVMFEERGNGVYIARQWVLKESNNPMNAIYKIAFIKKGKDGVLMYEDHPQNFSDPFYLKNLIEKTGFKQVEIFDDFDWNKKIDKNSKCWRTILIAKK